MTALLAGPPPIETLIPHRDPALLVRVVTTSSPAATVCIAVIPGDHPLVEGGEAPCFLGIEAAAQAAAAFEAIGRSAEPPGAPRLGYLVGVREARFELPRLPAGWPLRVTVRPTASAPPLSIFAAVIEIDGAIALTATFSTYLRAEVG